MKLGMHFVLGFPHIPSHPEGFCRLARGYIKGSLVKGFERTGKTRAILEDELTVLLAGRVAEELVFGDLQQGPPMISSV